MLRIWHSYGDLSHEQITDNKKEIERDRKEEREREREREREIGRKRDMRGGK